LHRRQGLGDKAASSLKPDSQKSTMEQVGDQAKGASDSVASSLQPGNHHCAPYYVNPIIDT